MAECGPADPAPPCNVTILQQLYGKIRLQLCNKSEVCKEAVIALSESREILAGVQVSGEIVF
jgi:hypothetical protein